MMLGCNRCMGQINIEPNHCCYCDAPSLNKPLGNKIEFLESENKRLEEQIEMWQDNFCGMVKIRDNFVKERNELLAKLEKLK